MAIGAELGLGVRDEVLVSVAVKSPRLSVEVSEHLVGSPAFKAGGADERRPAGSIPVHLRQRSAGIGR